MKSDVECTIVVAMNDLKGHLLKVTQKKLYTLPVNINGYIQFLINALDSIVRGWG